MINSEEIRTYCLQKSSVSEGFPFDNTTLVFKVHNKIFALCSLSEPLSLNLKCDPEKAMEYREEFSFVKPGYHMNKKHWNTIIINSALSKELLFQWIDESYRLVFNGLSAKLRNTPK